MFRIIADTIEYENRPVARFLDGLGCTFRDNVELDLESLKTAKECGEELETVWAERERELEEEYEGRIIRLKLEKSRVEDELREALDELKEAHKDFERLKKVLEVYDDVAGTSGLVEEIIALRATVAGARRLVEEVGDLRGENARLKTVISEFQKRASRKRKTRV